MKYIKTYCVSQLFIFCWKKKSELIIVTKNMSLLLAAVAQRLVEASQTPASSLPLSLPVQCSSVLSARVPMCALLHLRSCSVAGLSSGVRRYSVRGQPLSLSQRFIPKVNHSNNTVTHWGDDSVPAVRPRVAPWWSDTESQVTTMFRRDRPASQINKNIYWVMVFMTDECVIICGCWLQMHMSTISRTYHVWTSGKGTL